MRIASAFSDLNTLVFDKDGLSVTTIDDVRAIMVKEFIPASFLGKYNRSDMKTSISLRLGELEEILNRADDKDSLEDSWFRDTLSN